MLNKSIFNLNIVATCDFRIYGRLDGAASVSKDRKYVAE